VEIQLYEQECPLSHTLTISLEPFPECASVKAGNGPETPYPPQTARTVEVPEGTSIDRPSSMAMLKLANGKNLPPQTVWSFADCEINGFRFIE
tara:strand:+ start:77 stop:355 length:279 start_codon:yes stop_codon:yes gene_type:complete